MSRERAKILIIDDDPDVLRVVRLMIEREGYSTALAGDGQTGLRRIEEERPALVLLDIMMPVMDGWQVLEDLAHRRHPPRVVMLSAKTADEDRHRAFGLGAVGYVTKPFSMESLIRVVQTALASANSGGSGHGPGHAPA